MLNRKLINIFKKSFSISDIDTNKIILKKHNSFVSEIILNKPDHLNSVDYPMIRKILRITKNWIPETTYTSSSSSDSDEERESTPRILLMSGAGEKAFCAGGDVLSIYKAKQENNLHYLKNFFRHEYIMDFGLSIIKPIKVTFWQGFVIGGGVGLSINSPIKIACEKTHFAMPETGIGLFPDVGGSYFLPRYFGHRNIGLYYGLTGLPVKGKDVVRFGLATNYVEKDKLTACKEKILKLEKNNVKKSDILGVIKEFESEVEPFSQEQLEINGEITEDFEYDSIKAIYERVVKRKEKGSAWAGIALKKLDAASPTSLIVTFEQLKRGLEMRSIADAFNLEGQLVTTFMEENDFFEGVRALLIDKTGTAKWKYRSIFDVDEELIISQYFDRMEQIDLSD